MSKDERLEKAQARIDAMMQSDEAAVLTVKEAILAVMVRDGTADWARVEAHLIDEFDSSARLTKLRLAAAIDRLHEFQAKRG